MKQDKAEEEYENLFDNLILPGVKRDKPLPGEILVDPRKVQPLPLDHPLRQIEFHTIGNKEMKEIIEYAQWVEQNELLKNKK